MNRQWYLQHFQADPTYDLPIVSRIPRATDVVSGRGVVDDIPSVDDNVVVVAAVVDDRLAVDVARAPKGRLAAPLHAYLLVQVALDLRLVVPTVVVAAPPVAAGHARRRRTRRGRRVAARRVRRAGHVLVAAYQVRVALQSCNQQKKATKITIVGSIFKNNLKTQSPDQLSFVS